MIEQKACLIQEAGFFMPIFVSFQDKNGHFLSLPQISTLELG
jgi:hypothetical protein